MRNKLQEPEKRCYLTGAVSPLHKHHVYGGARRKLSEKYKCYIYLIPEKHNMSDEGIHFKKEFDTEVKQEFERRLLKAGWTKTEFIETFGKNYI